jgi:hypothetical protein
MFDNYLNGRVLISMTMNDNLYYLINYQYDFISVVTHVLYYGLEFLIFKSVDFILRK